MVDLRTLTLAIEAGDRTTATTITRDAIAEGMPPDEILAAMTTAMDEIGRRFANCEIYVPEMLISARAMKESTALLEPLLASAGVKPAFTAVIGTVKGDVHDIGKNLVAMMWRGANIEVVDLGNNVAPERFVEAARAHDARLVGVSALLTTTMLGMRDVVTAIREAQLDSVQVVVGGAPLTQAFADEIGANGYAPDAATAVGIAMLLVKA